MKLEINQTEQVEILNALDMAERSAKRAQNTGKNPQIKAIWETHERGIKALAAKIAELK